MKRLFRRPCYFSFVLLIFALNAGHTPADAGILFRNRKRYLKYTPEWFS